MYNLRYRNVNLSTFGDIISFDKCLLPKRNFNTINLEILNGEILQNNKYSALNIEITISINGDEIEELNTNLRQLANLLNVTTPQPLYINETVFYMAITDDEIEIDREYWFTRDVKISFICFDPCAYAMNEKAFNTNTKRLDIANRGTETVKPILSFGFTEDTHFVQAKYENKFLLLGDYPKLELSSASKTTRVLYEKCNNFDNWVDSVPLLDSNRDASGTLSINKTQSSFILGTVPSSSSSTWKGGCKRINLDTQLKEFQVKAWFTFNSPGENNDPNYDNLPGLNDETMEYEKVKYTSKQVMNYRDKPDKTGTQKGKLAKGFVLEDGKYDYEIVGEWFKFCENIMEGHSGEEYYYVSNAGGKYWTRKVYTTKKSDVSRNYKVTGREGSTSQTSSINVFSEPTLKSNIIGTINVGENIRCFEKDINDIDGNTTKKWKLMSNSYKEIKGYVTSNCIMQSENTGVWIDTSELEGYADDKTGVLELYGYDVSGSIMFKLAIEDSNKYYEYNQPSVRVGSTEIYKYDNKVKDPDTVKLSTTSGFKEYKMLQGSTGDWNEFFGNIVINRKKNANNEYEWEFIVQNSRDDLQITKTAIKSAITDEKELSYLAVYMGTNGEMTKACDMRIDNIEVLNLGEQSTEPVNNIYFHAGDVVDITQDGDVYLNDIQHNELLDIGSDIFDISTGTSAIDIVSDDANISTSTIFTEKWMGGEW